MASSFVHCTIHIGPRGADSGRYPVSVELKDGQRFAGRAEIEGLDIDAEALRQAQWSASAAGCGAILSRALFQRAAARGLDRAIAACEQGGHDGVRLRLCIDDDAPELHTLPWEQLTFDVAGVDQLLATDSRRPLSRYVKLESSPPAPVAARPVKLLFAVANPIGLPASMHIDVDAEIESFMEMLAQVVEKLPDGALSVTIMPGRSELSWAVREVLSSRRGVEVREHVPTSIERLIDEIGRGAHIVHFLGHGHFEAGGDGRRATTTLLLEDADGARASVDDVTLVTRLRGLSHRPHLMCLHACNSAERDGSDAVVGLAPRLLRAGVPAVLAQQDKLRMDDARALTRHFYKCLFEHGVVDLALNQARAQVFESTHLRWGVPVLYSQLRDGQLLAPMVGAPAKVPVDEPARAAPLPSLSQRQRDRLVDVLMNSPAMTNGAYRQKIIHRLGREIYAHVEQSAMLKLALSNLVDTCANRRGYVEALIAEVRAADGEHDVVAELDALLAEWRSQAG
ncbi:MAG: hypothetical protein Tsb0020_35580 [Haliangiales bacterium]